MLRSRETMSAAAEFQQLLRNDRPVLALAPMQDVTDLPFMALMAEYGGADYYVTEYFRVTETSRLDPAILRSITENPTGRPVSAQMIGNNIPALVRTARELQKYPIASVDLNLGCPAPVVYRKCAGGGLLRDLARVDGILGALREVIEIPFTVKTRLGFDAIDGFDELLRIFAKHNLDLVTIHGRTVLQGYRGEVHYDLIGRAARELLCPVVANGNIDSATRAEQVLESTGARGLMLGRGAIRNPWLFDQIRARLSGEPIRRPTGREVLHYVRRLYDTTSPVGLDERKQVQKMKKYLNFLGAGLDSSSEFLHDMRRASTEVELFRICREHLDHDEPLTLEPLESAMAK